MNNGGQSDFNAFVPETNIKLRRKARNDSPLLAPIGIVLDSKYQLRVTEWLTACFGPDSALDPVERLHRFLEEALELSQAAGCTKEEAALLVDYVFSRPKGGVKEEIGGVMLTLAGLCQASNVDMADAGDRELHRVWTRAADIRAKRGRRPANSPLPQ